MRRRANPRNRLSTATLVWQCRGPMARAVVLERETSWPCCSATEIYVTRLRRGNDQFMRRADGAVETRQPAVAQPAGCRVSIKHGATWGSRGELRCPRERALLSVSVLTDDVHRARCARRTQVCAHGRRHSAALCCRPPLASQLLQPVAAASAAWEAAKYGFTWSPWRLCSSLGIFSGRCRRGLRGLPLDYGYGWPYATGEYWQR